MCRALSLQLGSVTWNCGVATGRVIQDGQFSTEEPDNEHSKTWGLGRRFRHLPTSLWEHTQIS